MNWFARLIGRDKKVVTKSTETDTDAAWSDSPWSRQSVTGISINQATALNATAVMACVTMIAEDVAKCTPELYRLAGDKSRTVAADHFLYGLLDRPNDWQDWFEFCEQLVGGLVLRSNAYAVIRRNFRGVPTSFIPINPDWVALWEGFDGGLYYQVTPNGLHLRAVLGDEPFRIPAEDMLHIRGFSTNGLLGTSRISLGAEAIALGLAQEQTAVRWMGNGARPSGVLTTDGKLSADAAKRMADSWKSAQAGLQNSGKVALMEEGVKWQQLAMSSTDMEFIAARQFQLQEVARIFRVPLHMIGDLSRSTNNNITQQSQEYVNYTISGYTKRIRSKIAWHFGLKAEGLMIDFDMSEILRGDITARYNNYRTGIMSMFITPNEARADDGRNPMEGGDKLFQPANMAGAGSQSTGTAPDGAGRPADGVTV